MSNTLDITLHHKKLTVACPVGQEDSLLSSVEVLNNKLAETDSRTKNATSESVALITALNLCHELIQLKQTHHDNKNSELSLLATLEKLSQKIEKSLI